MTFLGGHLDYTGGSYQEGGRRAPSFMHGNKKELQSWFRLEQNELLAMFGHVLDLGFQDSSDLCKQYESEPYCTYPEKFQTGLIEHLANLPKEIRDKIYGHLILSWAPNSSFPQTRPTHGVVAIARRNKIPLYKDGPLEAYAKNREIYIIRKVCARSVYISQPAHHLPTIPKVISQFEERRGLLDYFKLEEYFNIVGFTKALTRHAAESHFSLPKGESQEASKALDLLEDFMRWFWNSIVLDLKDSWYETDTWAAGPKNTDSKKWLTFRPQFHAHITHLTLSIARYDLVHATSWTKLFNRSCRDLASSLPNLKTILLFLEIEQNEASKLLATPHRMVEGIRSLPACEKFDVKVGLRDGVTEEQRKLEDQHGGKESALRMLLMPERLFVEKSVSEVVRAETRKEMDTLGFETEASVGWFTMEGDGGKVEFETGTFLLVK